MTPGMDAELQDVDDARKSAIINNELKRLDIGKIRETDYNFFWRGNASTEHRIHGVAFAIRNTLLEYITEPSGGS